jgi:hypothetical protein
MAPAMRIASYAIPIVLPSVLFRLTPSAITLHHNMEWRKMKTLAVSWSSRSVSAVSFGLHIEAGCRQDGVDLGFG